MLKLPGKQANGPAGWIVQAKLTIYFWLGMLKHKQYFFAGLPKGYDMSQELRNAERIRALAPSNIHYVEKHVSRRTISSFVKEENLQNFPPLSDISTSCPYLPGPIANSI